jgi:hypothetical protein
MYMYMLKDMYEDRGAERNQGGSREIKRERTWSAGRKVWQESCTPSLVESERVQFQQAAAGQISGISPQSAGFLERPRCVEVD